MNLKISNIFAILTLSGVFHAKGSNILVYFAISGYSHRISIWPVLEKLADAGHNVTFLSPFPNKNLKTHPNIEEYIPANLARDLGVINLDFIGIRLREGVPAIQDLWNHYHRVGLSVCDSLYKNPEYVEWARNSSFDLVITNAMFGECGYPIAYKSKAKLVVYSPTSHIMWFKDAFGYPDENLPEIQYHYPLNMNFLQSVKNEMVSLFWQARRLLVTFPTIWDVSAKALGLKDLPPLQDIESNVSLVFTYSHPVEDFARSLPPNVVEVGGMHCTDKRKPLPQELEEFISNGDDGFVLISFGTYAAISSLPKYLQEVFFEAIKKLPHLRFLVKYQGAIPTDFPSNALPVQWIPQQDLIAHPKIRAFVGHGGLLGTQEAVYHGVPMIVIPLFVEQDYQAVRAHERQTSIALELRELTVEDLYDALLQITTDPKYKNNVVKLSKLFRDRQVKPTDTAYWWIEYVLRHNDFEHLRPIGMHRTWYERRMLHIWGFLFLTTAFLITVISLLVYFTFMKLFRHNIKQISVPMSSVKRKTQ